MVHCLCKSSLLGQSIRFGHNNCVHFAVEFHAAKLLFCFFQSTLFWYNLQKNTIFWVVDFVSQVYYGVLPFSPSDPSTHFLTSGATSPAVIIGMWYVSVCGLRGTYVHMLCKVLAI